MSELLPNRRFGILVAILLLVASLTGFLAQKFPHAPPKTGAQAPTDKEVQEVHLSKAYELLNAGRFAETQKLLRGLLRRNYRDPEILRLLGKSYYAEQRYTEAEEVFRQLVERNELDASALNNLGQTLFKQHRNPEARVFLERALEQDATSPYILLNLSDVLRVLGHEEEARALRQKAQDEINRRLSSSSELSRGEKK